MESEVPPAADGPPSPASSEEQSSEIDAALFSFLQDILARFGAAKSIEEQWTLYAELRDRVLRSPDPLVAARTIEAFLATGRDAETGLPFQVGTDGFLESAPTVRTGLLDFVAELDSETSLRLARQVLDSRTSPDEYALALRNLAWSPLTDDSGREEVASRFSTMLDQNEWLAQPTLGFLEAFDTAVALSGRQSVLDLASVAGLQDASGNPIRNGVNEAATLALDRIMLRSPETVASVFREQPDFLDHRPLQRATLMARLDIRQPDQRALFMDYLGRLPVGSEEIDLFTGLFPNMTFSYGPRLISSQEDAPSILEMQEIDRSFLQILRNAAAAGQVANPAAAQAIIANLQRHVSEADATAGVPPETAPAINLPGMVANPPSQPRNPATTGAPGRIRSF